MKKSELKEDITKITSNESLSIDERIDLVLNLRNNFSNDDDKKNRKNDIIFLSLMIEMVEKENAPHIYDMELLELYGLLMETYDELEEYREMKGLAHSVLELLRPQLTKWDAAQETVPVIIEALGNSVYNHALFELLLLYIRMAWKAGKLNESIKGFARKMLKLHILLEDAGSKDFRLLPQELRDALANLFTPSELLKIILSPDIGHLKKDPVEYSWEWEDIYYHIEDKLEQRFANAPKHMGFCFKYWEAKKELLKEEYNIDWRSPAQMNPRVRFD